MKIKKKYGIEKIGGINDKILGDCVENFAKYSLLIRKIKEEKNFE